MLEILGQVALAAWLVVFVVPLAKEVAKELVLVEIKNAEGN